MTIRFLSPFVRDYKKLDPPVRDKVDAFLQVLAVDVKHPSLKVRKMVNRTDIYEARVDLHYRVTFTIIENAIYLRRVGTHQIYRKP